MRLYHFALAAMFLSLLASSPRIAWADDPRVAEALHAYVAQCAQSLSSQGMSSQKAETVCACAASGIAAEVQFGVAGDRERYGKIMQAQPNPSGSPDDQRLYKIIAPCFAP